MKNKIIPFFSARKINKIEDYERFYHTKSYIKQKSDLISNKNDLIKLMKISGYSKMDKFIRHRKEWDNLERNIPLDYLNHIGIDLNTLKTTVEIDQEEYEDVLKLPLYPKYFTVRYMPTIYGSVKLPDNCLETEAIEIVKNFSKKTGLKCNINYLNLKTILIERDNVYVAYYKPEIRITNKLLIISKDYSTKIGICKV